MVKTKLIKIILLVILAINASSSGSTILKRKVIVKGKINYDRIHSFDMFLTQYGSLSFLVIVHDKPFLYIDGDLIEITREKGIFLDAFVADNHVMLAFGEGGKIVFYDAQDEFKLTNSIHINRRHSWAREVITVSDTSDRFYMLCSKVGFFSQPLKKLRHIMSGGHAGGDIYSTPYIMEIEGSDILWYKKIKHDHGRDVTYLEKEFTGNTTMIHFLGFIQSEDPRTGRPLPDLPVVLYYAGYDLKKKKVTQSYSIHEEIIQLGAYDFGPLSIASKEDAAFVAFSLYKFPPYPRKFNYINCIKQGLVESNIYYFQYENESASSSVKIAEGFIPLVKLDSVGNVYVFWVDHHGNLIYRMKKEEKWSRKKIILNGIDIMYSISEFDYISVEFDKQNNLHVVFPSRGNLVYAKVKLDFTSGKQN